MATRVRAQAAPPTGVPARVVNVVATAIAKMKGGVAARLGLRDRGTLAVGQAADIVLFDPQEVRDRGTYLAPCQKPAGVAHVFVNGVAVIRDGAQTDARPGRVLRAA